MFTKKILIALTTLSVLASCEGPQGPMGNANVIIWKTEINSNNWVEDGQAYRYTFNCPAINDEVINGTYQVTTALKISDNGWVQAPYIIAGTDYTESCQFYYLGGNPAQNCGLYAYADDNFTSIHLGIREIKIAVIEGLSGKKEITIEDIEKNPELYNITYINN